MTRVHSRQAVSVSNSTRVAGLVCGWRCRLQRSGPQSPAEACCQATVMWMPAMRARMAAGRSVAGFLHYKLPQSNVNRP